MNTEHQHLHSLSDNALQLVHQDVSKSAASIHSYLSAIQTEMKRRGQNASASPKVVTGNRVGQGHTPKERRDKILEVCVEHSKSIDNAPIMMRALVPVVEGQGIVIGGKKPGTTLGAIATKSGFYEPVPRQQGHWRLKQNVYEEP